MTSTIDPMKLPLHISAPSDTLHLCHPGTRPVGFWRTHPNSPSPLPWPEVGGLNLGPREVNRLVTYLHLTGIRDTGRLTCEAMCRLCHLERGWCIGVGAAEYSDGEWSWPAGLAHYVFQHRVALPPEFVERALTFQGELPYTSRPFYAVVPEGTTPDLLFHVLSIEEVHLRRRSTSQEDQVGLEVLHIRGEVLLAGVGGALVTDILSRRPLTKFTA